MPPRKHNSPRYEDGRLKVSQTYDRGNLKIAGMRALYDAKCFQGGGRGRESYDGIGQLWLVGKLEGHPIESVRLLDVGREYARLWHQRYKEMEPKIAKYERSDRSTGGIPRRTKDDVKFERMTDCLPAKSEERHAIYELVCKYHLTDGMQDWVARLVADRLLAKGFVFPLMELSGEEDNRKLEAAIRGLFALHDGELPSRHLRAA